MIRPSNEKHKMKLFFFLNNPPTTEISPLSLPGALPILGQGGHLNQISAAAWLPAVLLAYDRFATTRRVYWLGLGALALALQLLAGHPQETYMTLIILDRKSTRLNSSHSQISYAVFCLKK